MRQAQDPIKLSNALPTDAVPPATARQEARLWRSPAAIASVRGWGLADATIRRFHLGLKEPYLSRETGLVTDHALSFPLLGTGGWIANRFAYLNIAGVTSNANHPIGWGPGPAIPAFSRRPFNGASLLVVDSIVRMWTFAQILDKPGTPVVIVCRSHARNLPADWLTERFWSCWSRVTLALDGTISQEELARAIASRSTVPVHAIPSADLNPADGPPGTTAMTARLLMTISDAPLWVPRPALQAGEVRYAPVAAAPLVLEGAYRRGRMYYPVTMERSTPGGDDEGALTSYVVRVLRSDGVFLDAATLAHPPSTPVAERVVTLSDGTRITEMPRPNAHGSWSHLSIGAFVTARSEGVVPAHRALSAILGDVELHLRSVVWLPDPDSYAAVALFTAASHVHRVFDAMPILFLNGPAGSGKSELGATLAALGPNGMLVGQVSGAGLIRLIEETRGVLVIDDLEMIARGPSSSGSEIAQVLKCSYKQSTARKAIPGQGGRVRIYDFYGPKVVSNIGGADEVLRSRMLPIRTAPCHDRQIAPAPLTMSTDELRDELHVWAMCEAAEVERAYLSTSDGVTSREQEIAAPLRALARLSGDARLADRLGRWLTMPCAASPARRETSSFLAEALRTVQARGACASISLSQIQLELAVMGETEGGTLDAPSAETIGRLLLSIGARRDDVPVARRRLYGIVTRIYALVDTGTAEHPLDPLAFCTQRPCTSCPYLAKCDRTLPGLRVAKARRHPA